MKHTEWAAPVAQALGDGWTVEPGAWSNNVDAYLAGPDGVRVHVMGPPHAAQGRVELHGTIGDELVKYVRSEKTPEITVAVERPAAQVARAIERRLLPGLSTLLTSLRERKAARDLYDRERRELAGLLASVLGPACERQELRDRTPTLEVGRFGDPLRWKIEVSGGDSAEFTVRCDRAGMAIALAGHLAEMRRTGGGAEAPADDEAAAPCP